MFARGCSHCKRIYTCNLVMPSCGRLKHTFLGGFREYTSVENTRDHFNAHWQSSGLRSRYIIVSPFREDLPDVFEALTLLFPDDVIMVTRRTQNMNIQSSRTARLTTRLVTGIAPPPPPYEERLQRQGLHSIQGRRLRADRITAFNIFTGLLDIDQNLFFLPSVRRSA